MFKITNISNHSVGLITFEFDGSYHQEDLGVGESKLIETCSDQIYNLCDPYKNIIRVEEVE